MKVQGKQITRSSDNLSMLYLSPYAYAEQVEDGIFITRTDAEQGIQLDGYSETKVMSIFHKLKNGIEQDEITILLRDIMTDEAASEFVELLLQEGVIE